MPQFTLSITPRSYEMDALGHINNNAISAWFEVVRTRLMESLEITEAGAGFSWVLASISIDFFHETHYGRDVIATVLEATPGRSSVTIDCEMSQRGVKTTFGRAVMVNVDPDTRRPAPMSPSAREKFCACG